MREWELFLQQQRDRLGSEVVQRWTSHFRVVDFDARNLYLETADPFQLHWFEEHLRPVIKTSLRTESGRPISVHLSLTDSQERKPSNRWKPILDLSPDPVLAHTTFDTYFTSDSNSPTVKLLQETLEHSTFNPIYLHGPQGVGKTHLLMAAYHLLQDQGKQCFYVKVDRFTQHIVAAIRAGKMKQLRELYRKSDALFVDEIDDFEDRTASQEEFFHTFNAMHLAGKPLVLAGRSPPTQLKGIEPRLTSRFEWGIVLSLSPLDSHERGLYLDLLLHRQATQLPEKIKQLCLSSLSSLSRLKRAVDLLSAQGAPIASLEAAHVILAPLLREERTQAITPESVLRKVSSHFDISLDALTGRSQTQEHVGPRQIAMYLCRTQLNLSYVKIGKLFSRDHSTVMTSVKLVNENMKNDTSLRQLLETLR